VLVGATNKYEFRKIQSNTLFKLIIKRLGVAFESARNKVVIIGQLPHILRTKQMNSFQV